MIFKTYCLRCRKPNMGCHCRDKNKTIIYSNKLRPPTSIRNKAKFRKFLDDCPTFVNFVTEDLYEDFRGLLRAVKYFNKRINGFEWTEIGVK